MDDILDIIVHDYSSIQIKKLIELYSQNQTKSIFSLTSKIFVFYFRQINIEISHRKALSYVEFILNEIYINCDSDEKDLTSQLAKYNIF